MHVRWNRCISYLWTSNGALRWTIGVVHLDWGLRNRIRRRGERLVAERHGL